MSKKKKGIIALITIVVITAIIVGGIYGFTVYRNNTLLAEVESVESLQYYYWGDESSSYGMVTNDAYQDVNLLEEQRVNEVFVEEGQEVKIGDSLLSYDMTLTDLDIQMGELEIETIGNNILLAQRELEKLRKTTPIPERQEAPVAPEVPDEPEPTETVEEPQIDEMKKDAYNYISATAKYYKGEGTIEDPYLYLCTPECYVEGAFLNVLAESKSTVFVVFEIRENNKKKGDLLSSWPVNSKSLMKVDDGSKWSIKTRQEIIEEVEEDPPEDPQEDPDIIDEEPEQTGYTAAELKDEIQKKEQELKSLDLDKRKAELSLVEKKKLSSEGIVTAKLDGIVKTVGDKDRPPTDGSAFLTVSGSEGLYITGSISELKLGEVKLGQTVYASSWENGMNFEATIQEISEYPSEVNNGWSEGNQNVSFYPYIAYIENTEGLKNGDYLELRMTANNNDGGTESGVLYLQRAYIREEDGRSYVLKADENNRLLKQYVETGKIIYGEGIEIKSGLTVNDRIAFPYGKTAKEGLKIKDGFSGETDMAASYY